MEEILIEKSYGLIVWQIVLITLIVFALYFVIKLYKKMTNYLDLKTKYLRKKIENK